MTSPSDMLSRRILALRKAHGLSQADLARILNISASALGMYEQGRRTPSLETLVAMSKFFGISLDHLVTGKEFIPSQGMESPRSPENCPCSTCYWKEYLGLQSKIPPSGD